MGPFLEDDAQAYGDLPLSGILRELTLAYFSQSESFKSSPAMGLVLADRWPYLSSGRFVRAQMHVGT